MDFSPPHFVYLPWKVSRLLLLFGTFTLLSSSFPWPFSQILHFIAMGSCSSSRDLNELSDACSRDFQTSEKAGSIAAQQGADGHESENTNIDEEKASKLPRADGGRDAWMFLAGCFVFEALIWGETFLWFSDEHMCLEPIFTI